MTFLSSNTMSAELSFTSALSNRSLSSTISESAFFCTINITAIAGNAFVIAAMARNPGLRKITHWYILSLAIADLLVAVTCMPLSLGAAVKGTWLYSDVTCQIQGHVIQVWLCFSLTVVAATAIYRYYRVVRPTRYRKIFTKRFAIILALSSLGLSAIVAVGMMYIVNARFQFGPHFFCTPNFPNERTKKTVALPIFLTFIITPLTVVLFCYFKVYRTVRRHTMLVAPNLRLERLSQSGTENKLTCRVDEINATKMVFAIILVFCLLWIPVSIIGALYVCDVFLPRWTHLMYDYLVYMTAATNPLIYGLMNNAFRAEYVRIVRCQST